MLGTDECDSTVCSCVDEELLPRIARLIGDAANRHYHCRPRYVTVDPALDKAIRRAMQPYCLSHRTAMIHEPPVKFCGVEIIEDESVPPDELHFYYLDAGDTMRIDKLTGIGASK